MGIRIRDTPADQRPRERLWASGVGVLTDRELLALILRTGRHGRSALELADELLAEFGGVAELAIAKPEELARWPGVGEAKAASLAAAFQLSRRSRTVAQVGRTVRSLADIAEVARRELAGARRERVVVLVCDGRNRLRRLLTVSEGSLDRALVPVREILNAVLRYDGRAFAVAHNHPSDDPTPSAADLRATAELAQGALTTGLRFLGHVIVSGSRWQSSR